MSKDGIIMVLIAIAIILGGIGTLGFITDEEITGEPGPQGEVGPQGPPGPTGDDGIDGIDCTANTKPTIEILFMEGLLEDTSYPYKYKFYINTGVTDMDNDSMHIKFYYRTSETSDWTLLSEKIGTSGEYKEMKTYTTWYHPMTLYWLVEAWDGQDITLLEAQCKAPTTWG